MQSAFKTGNIGYIVVSQAFKWQQNWQHTGNKLATFWGSTLGEHAWGAHPPPGVTERAPRSVLQRAGLARTLVWLLRVRGFRKGLTRKAIALFASRSWVVAPDRAKNGRQPEPIPLKTAKNQTVVPTVNQVDEAVQILQN